jgi:uncharacterized protein
VNVIDIVLASGGLFIAGLIKGVTGIGFSTCALPFLVLAVGLKPAMAIVTIPALVSNFAVIAGGVGLGQVLNRFWPFYVAIAPGILVGTAAIAFVDLRSAVQLLAVLTLAYVWLALVRPDLTLAPWVGRAIAVPAGLLNGFLTGLTGSQIVPLMPYMMALKLAPEEQVQAVNLAVSLASAVLAAALAGAGVMTAELAMASAAGVLPAVAGVSIGGRLRGKLSPAAFRHVALATLAVLALSLYGKGPAQNGISCAAIPGVAGETTAAAALSSSETIR